MKFVTIKGASYTESWPVEGNIVERVAITVELHNRDNPDDLWVKSRREKVKKFSFLFIVLAFLVSCASPVINQPVQTLAPTVTPDQPIQSTQAIPSPPNVVGDVKLAKYIRLPGSIVSRGNFGVFTDPDESKCTDPESVYIFFDDNSIVQYKPYEGGYSNLADRARITIELRLRDWPDAPWDYVAVPPTPPPPPVTEFDPILKPLTIAFCDDTGVIRWSYTATDNADYDRVLGVLAMTLELHNRDNDPDCHVVYGGKV
jgi:hypothetical protein